jgi:hypothetical protein
MMTLIVLPYSMRCSGQAVLGWTPPTDPTVAGYYLVWGLSSSNYTSTNSYPASQASAEIDDLITNQVYYINIASYNASGIVGSFAGEIEFTNGAPDTNPPTPPSLTAFGTSTNNGTMSGNGGGIGSLGGKTVGSTAANFWGVPTRLTLIMSNGAPNMNIGGTVGATVMIQGTTNLFSADSWETMETVALTNIAPVALSNQASQSEDALDLAFVPAAQMCPLALSNSSRFQFFRTVMPYDYVILGSMVLSGKGYRPRLIIVNMPGIVCDDACYVTEGSSFIHYDRGNFALQLEGSGPTLRQIATTLANSLSLNWTSASEFTYSNGLAQIVNTVVETEPSSSDRVPGEATPAKPVAIDF